MAGWWVKPANMTWQRCSAWLRMAWEMWGWLWPWAMVHQLEMASMSSVPSASRIWVPKASVARLTGGGLPMEA